MNFGMFRLYRLAWLVLPWLVLNTSAFAADQPSVALRTYARGVQMIWSAKAQSIACFHVAELPGAKLGIMAPDPLNLIINVHVDAMTFTDESYMLMKGMRAKTISSGHDLVTKPFDIGKQPDPLPFFDQLTQIDVIASPKLGAHIDIRDFGANARAVLACAADIRKVAAQQPASRPNKPVIAPP